MPPSAILSIAGCWIAIGVAVAEPVTEEDVAVWHSILDEKHDGKAGQLVIWKWLERSQIYNYGAMNRFRESMKELEDELVDSFNERNWSRKNRIKLEAEFRANEEQRYFDEATMEKKFGKVLDPGWWISPKAFEDCGSIVRLSLPGYNVAKSKAVVFAAIYQHEAQRQTFFVVTKRGDKWSIIEEETWWEYDGSYTSKN